MIHATNALLSPEDRLAALLDAEGIPYTRQFRFHPRRKFAADFLIPPKILVEVQGGGFVQGRHTQGKGLENDCERQAEALTLGYVVLPVTPRQIDNLSILRWLRKLLET